MKTFIHGLLILPMAMCILLAQIPEDGYYGYLQELGTRYDSEIPEFIIDECWNYLRTYPGSKHVPGVLSLLGNTYQNEKDYAEAFATYMKHVILFPQDVNKNDMITAINQIVHNRAERMFREKRTNIDEFLTTPNNSLPLVTSGYKYLKFIYDLDIEDLYDFLRQEITWYLNIFPKEAKYADELLMCQAEMYEKKKDWDEAASVYLKILYIAPESVIIPQTLYQIGMLQYHELRKYENSRDTFTKIITDYSESDIAGDAQFYLGELYQNKLDNFNEAVANYRLLIETYPKNKFAVEALKRVAEIKEDMDAFEDAIATYYQIFELYPSDVYTPEALLEIAALYRRKFDNYEKTIETLKLYAKQYPQREDAAERLYDAADIYEDELQNAAAAIETYREVTTQFPDSKYAKKAQERIEKLSVN